MNIEMPVFDSFVQDGEIVMDVRLDIPEHSTMLYVRHTLPEDTEFTPQLVHAFQASVLRALADVLDDPASFRALTSGGDHA